MLADGLPGGSLRHEEPEPGAASDPVPGVRQEVVHGRRELPGAASLRVEAGDEERDSGGLPRSVPPRVGAVITRPTMIDLSGRVALVTGGSRGIGHRTAVALAKAGADIAITYLNSRRNAEEVGEEIIGLGRRVLAIRADLAEAEDVGNAIDAIRDQLGRLDIVVSNAAGGGFRPLMEVSEENFDYALHLNVRAFMLLMQKAAPLLERREEDGTRSKVITLSSWGAERALPMYGVI